MRNRGYLSRVKTEYPELYQPAKQFDEYLFYISTTDYEISGYDPVAGKFVTQSIDHITRYHETYRKSVLARWYRIDKEYDLRTITMMTLTTAQDGKWARVHGKPRSIFEACYALKAGWSKVRKMLNKAGIKSYAYVYEPHPGSGYPHLHVMIFGDILGDGELYPSHLEHKIRTAWQNDYKLGSRDHGVDFRVVNPQFARSYLLKYVLKDMSGDGWTFEQYLFHLHFWLTRMRLWGMSRSVSLHVASTRRQEEFSENPAAVRWQNERRVSAVPAWYPLLCLTGQEDADVSDGILTQIHYSHSKGSIRRG